LNCKHKPQLRERLAAEYAVGTLRGAARARFRRWMLEDGALARAVGEWEARLAPMAAGVAPVRPPVRVWREIEARLRPAPLPYRPRSAFWRALGLVAGGAAAALAATTMVLSLQTQTPASGEYLAVLSDPKTLRPVLLVSAARQDDRLRIKTLDPAIRVPNASLELWALPAEGKPRSLGLIPSASKGELQLASMADLALSDVPALAVSLEPKGGSPTGAPTGPVLYSGPCVKDW
jgi:anti-sigma-K factor RskA